MSTSEYITEYLEDQRMLNKESTFRTRKSHLKRFQEQFLDPEGLSPEDLDANDLHRYLRSISGEYAENTVTGHYLTIHNFYKVLAGRWDEYDDNPFESLDYERYEGNGSDKKTMTEISYLSREEIERLCEHVPSPKIRNELIVRMMFETGVRPSEVVEIEIDNVTREPEKPNDPRPIEVWAEKTDEWRTVYYQAGLIDRLIDVWLGRRDGYVTADDSPYLFVGERSDQLNPDSTVNSDVVVRAAHDAGLQEEMYTDAAGKSRWFVTAHTLRHSHAVAALKDGVSLGVLQQNMGHEDIETTLKYLRLLDDDVQEGYRNFGPSG